MSFLQRTGGQLTWLVLSLLGVLISIYLTTVHYQGVPLVCSATGLVDCASVLSSAYSVVPGTTLPITLPGILWFVVGGVLAFAGWRLWPERRTIRIAEFVWALLGLVTVFYLIYAEIVRLHKICAWCTGVHVIILLMLIVAVFQLQRPESEEELDEDADEIQPVSAKHN